ICGHEGSWFVDRPVDMALGCEMQDQIGLEFRVKPSQQGTIVDVPVDEGVARLSLHRSHGGQIGCIGEAIKVEDSTCCVRQQKANDSRSNKAGAAGYHHALTHKTCSYRTENLMQARQNVNNKNSA